MRLKATFKREKAPDHDDVMVASSIVKSSGTLFWTMRSAANLALALGASCPTDPVIRAHLRQLTSHLKELEVIR